MEIPKMDKITRIQMLVTGFAFIILLILINYFIIHYPLNDNAFYTVCIIIVSLVWIYSFYKIIIGTNILNESMKDFFSGF